MAMADSLSLLIGRRGADLCTAQEILKQLAPLFEKIRRQREMPFSYPLTVGRSLVKPTHFWVKREETNQQTNKQKNACHGMD